MALVLGLNAKLYRNTGTWAAPVWDLIGNVKDLTLNLETGEADVTVRGSGGWRLTVGTLKEGSIEFEMIWDTADPDFTAIQEAFFGNTLIDLAAMDGDITVEGSQGLRAEMSITNFTRNEPLEEALTASVTAKPSYSENAPLWYTVPAP